MEERRGAMELLAALASYDHALLRQATMVDIDTGFSAEARDLLVEAATVER